MEATVNSRLSLLSAGAIEFCPSENRIVSSGSEQSLTAIILSKDFHNQPNFVDQNKNSLCNSSITLNGNKEQSFVNANKEKVRISGSENRDTENDNSYISLNGNKEKTFRNALKEKIVVTNGNENSVKDDKSFITLNGNKPSVNANKDKVVANNCKEKVVEDGIPVPKQIIYSGKIQVNWRQPRKIGAGLENLGNTCFINTVIQCLTYCPPLTNHLLYETDHSAKCTIVGFCMMCVLQSHIKKVLNSSNQVVRPLEVCGKLRSIAKHFQHGRQEDAHEFLRYVIENLWRSCLLQNGISSKLDSASKETTIINQIFGGYHRSQVMCSKCKERSNTYDHFMDFILDIKQNVLTLEAALRKFTEPEILENDNAYKCPKCKMKVEALKRFTVHKAPNVATFQLKRFDYNRSFGGKITKQITYPDVLNLRPFMSDPKGEPVLYHLNAVLVHAGQTCNSGHYYCYVKNSDGSWYIMDDSRVHRVNINQVLSQSAYVLFYVKSTPSDTFNCRKSLENGIVSKKVDTYAINNKRLGEISNSKPLVQNNQLSSPQQKKPLYPTVNLNKRNGLSPNVNNREKIVFQASKPQDNSTPPNKIIFHNANTSKTENHQQQGGLVPYNGDSSDSSSDENDTVKLVTPLGSNSSNSFVGAPNSLSSKSESFTSFNIKRKQSPKPVLNVNRLSNTPSSSSTPPKVIATSVWTVTDARSRSPGAESNSSVHSTTDWHITLSDSERPSPEARTEKPGPSGDKSLTQNGDINSRCNVGTSKQHDFRKQDASFRSQEEESPLPKRKCSDSNQELPTNSKLHNDEDQLCPVPKKIKNESDSVTSDDPAPKKFKTDSVNSESPTPKKFKSDTNSESPTSKKFKSVLNSDDPTPKIFKNDSNSVHSENPSPKILKVDSNSVKSDSDSHYVSMVQKFSHFTKKEQNLEFKSKGDSHNLNSPNYRSPKKIDCKYENNSHASLKNRLDDSRNSANCSNSSNSSFEYEWVEKTKDSSHNSFKGKHSNDRNEKSHFGNDKNRKLDVAKELNNSSKYFYDSSVLTWNGHNHYKESDNKKRKFFEEYEDEYDRGKVRKFKPNNGYTHFRKQNPFQEYNKRGHNKYEDRHYYGGGRRNRPYNNSHPKWKHCSYSDYRRRFKGK